MRVRQSINRKHKADVMDLSRDLYMISLRLRGFTVQSIADYYNISQQRVSQILARSWFRIRRIVIENRGSYAPSANSH